MSTSYSPIDESSLSDGGGFDPAAMFNGTAPAAQPTRPVQRGKQPAKPDETPAPAPATANAGAAASMPAASATPAPSAATTDMAEDAGNDYPDEPGSESAMSKIWHMMLDSRTAMFIGLLLVVLSAYSFIVCLSYLNNIGSDQSAVLSADYDPSMIRNAGGPVGAWLAHTLIYNYLGVGAFILIGYFLACGLMLLKIGRMGFWGLTVRCLLGAVSLSMIAGLVTYELASPIYWGGLHGYILNQKLMLIAGAPGAVCVSLLLAGMMVILYLNEIKKVFGRTASAYSSYSARQAARRAAREERRQAEEAARQEREAREKAEAEAKAAMEAKAAAATPAPATATAPASQPAKPLFTQETEEDEEMEEDEDEIVADEYDSDQDELFGQAEDDADADGDDEADDNAPLFGPEEEAAEPSEPLFSHDTPKEREIDATGQPLYDPRADLSHFRFPSIDLLNAVNYEKPSVDAEEMESNKARITKTLNDYGIPISHIQATVGPTVTLYEIIPAEGVRIAKIKRLEDDIALSLAALGIRIIAPIPGKGTIGIEVPNKDPQTVSMRSIIESPVYQNCHMELPMAMGKTISNEVFVADLCKMPHLLVAGATGMGKSVGLNAIIASLLYKKHPAELKFVLIDPKMVEFSLYSKLERHYLAKLPGEEDAIITDPTKVVATLNSLCVEMDNRYALLKDASMRNIKEYNERFCRHSLLPSRGHRFLPYIVVVVDEFADLIMTAGKEVETPIARIAQKARAVGIHMILATQRPSTNVITGVIKANFPGRVAFRVFQMVDSRTIIDRPGANQLIGRGDMLFSNNGKIDRVQCAFIDTPEVKAICDAISDQVGYSSAYELPEYVPEGGDSAGLGAISDRDPLFEECARFIISADQASTSSLQRRFSIGYNRAGKIMGQLEAAGIVGPNQGAKPRAVLVDSILLESMLASN